LTKGLNLFKKGAVMKGNTGEPSSLDRNLKAGLVVDMLTRLIVHYGFWFTEVRHQMGLANALEILEKATEKSISIGLKKFAEFFDFELEDGLPKALFEIENSKIDELMEVVAKTWLANDGMWFQAIEFKHGMNDAKRCNDSCWAQFSPYEAFAIKRFLKLEDRCGLEGLKKALNFRMYSLINKQSIVDEGPQNFVFQMNDCRVQSARKRKKLDDYPCKSVGLVEYTYFARAMDDRIETECIGCPPDVHPDDWFCAWRFSIK
jgi:hypothetical protein